MVSISRKNRTDFSQDKNHRNKIHFYSPCYSRLLTKNSVHLCNFQAQEFSENESDSDEEIARHKGVEGLIEIDNPNLNSMISKQKKISTLRLVVGPSNSKSNFSSPKMRKNSTKSEISEKARADLARLTIIRQQREEASKKREKELTLKNEAAKIKAVNKSKGL